MQNYHILKVSNFFDNRDLMPKVRVTSERFKQSVTMYYNNDHGFNNPAIDTAEKWLKSHGFECLGAGEGKSHYYIISTTFKGLKESPV